MTKLEEATMAELIQRQKQIGAERAAAEANFQKAQSEIQEEIDRRVAAGEAPIEELPEVMELTSEDVEVVKLGGE